MGPPKEFNLNRTHKSSTGSEPWHITLVPKHGSNTPCVRSRQWRGRSQWPIFRLRRQTADPSFLPVTPFAIPPKGEEGVGEGGNRCQKNFSLPPPPAAADTILSMDPLNHPPFQITAAHNSWRVVAARVGQFVDRLDPRKVLSSRPIPAAPSNVKCFITNT